MIVLNVILYYLIILPISLLPYPLLYAFSDFLFVIIYYLAGYRKKVVYQNIRNSFPEKTEQECKEIMKKFYRHFCDLIVEGLKTFTISEKQIHKRFVCINPEVIDKYYNQKRAVVVATGHYNNWEMLAVSVNLMIKHTGIGIYTALSNPYFENKMRLTRGKYGLEMVPTKTIKQFLEDNKNRLIAPLFGMDQSPSNPKNAYWMQFLNQETGVQFGVEKYAKDNDWPVLYCRLNKVKRGMYTLEFFDVTDKPKEMGYGEIVKKVTQLLEKDIINAPQYWLWTHRRWKHKRPTE
jgi:KDO2-lipid IV(A) lauroyltransferase